MSADWFTEEMVEAAARRLFQLDWPTKDWEEISDYWEEVRAEYRDRTRKSLEAITPMVTKWVGDLQASEGDLMREDGYRAGERAGYEKGYKAGRDDAKSIERW